MKKYAVFLLFLGMLFSAVGGSAYFIFKKTTSHQPVEMLSLPQLTGPSRLCNLFGSVLGSFSGGGIPLTDVYIWKIYDPSNALVFDRKGGFETITFTFTGNGPFRVELEVERGGIPIYKDNKIVQVVLGPKINLKPNYSFCDGESVTLHALDPSSSNFSDYKFEWRNSVGTLISSNNELIVNYEDNFTVSYFFLNASGGKDCDGTISTSTKKISGYSINASETKVCPDLPTNFFTTPNILGTWKYLKSGESIPVNLGYGTEIRVLPNQNLNGEGDYTIFFEPDPSNNPSCLPAQSFPLSYLPQPEFIVFPSMEASNCDTFDGELTIQAVTNLDYVFLEGLGTSTPSIAAGSSYTITGLKSGTYTLIGVLGSCNNAFGSIVPLLNPPNQLVFSITDIQGETCTPTGKDEGSFLIKFQNPPSSGGYKIINQKGTLVEQSSFTNSNEIAISIPGGVYYVEVLDDNDCNIPESSEVIVPSLNQTQFNIPSELTICQSYELIPETTQDLEFTITYPDGSTETKPKGSAFQIIMAGEHSVVGVNPGQPSDCPSEKLIDVFLVDPVDFEPILINQDCFGNRTYEANIFGRDPTSVIFRWYNEVDDLVGTGQFLNPVSNGTFKLDVQPANSEACPIPPVEFEIKEPILSVEVILEATKLCEYGPRALVDLSSTFPDEITDIEWRRFDGSGNIIPLPQFKDQWQIIADEPGTYEAAVFSRIPSINKNCELGRNTIKLDLILNKVDFDIPTELSICEPYSLIPNSLQALEFELTYPDGSIEVKNWNEDFLIDQGGTYTLLGYDPNIQGPLCPEQKTFEVKVLEPVEFSPQLADLSCTGEYLYQAEVENYQPNEVDYFWRDPSGNLVSTSSQLTTSTYGVFTLEVQPKGSFPCSNQEFSFEIPIPKLTIPVAIIAETLCPDQSDAALTLEADLDPDFLVRWWFTDLSNNQRELVGLVGKTEILAVEEGTYEARVINQYGCLLGSANTLVIRSTDQIRPILEESYQICPNLGIGPSLNPGSFASYEWYFGDRLVSNSPIYKPDQIGIYYLIVYSNEGCAYETSFETLEECELRVSFPNAIQPGNPDKGFLIYSNYLIDELEVWILNKWGNEVFQCKNFDLKKGEATCIWDGFYRGEKVISGTYAVKISYRNLEKNIQEERFGTILVID
jgi:hypothetical protein